MTGAFHFMIIGIAAGIAWAVLWSEAEKELQENLREAVQDLRRAQERKWMSECGES